MDMETGLRYGINDGKFAQGKILGVGRGQVSRPWEGLEMWLNAYKWGRKNILAFTEDKMPQNNANTLFTKRNDVCPLNI